MSLNGPPPGHATESATWKTAVWMIGCLALFVALIAVGVRASQDSAGRERASWVDRMQSIAERGAMSCEAGVSMSENPYPKLANWNYSYTAETEAWEHGWLSRHAEKAKRSN